jgi:hypothetical protein
MSKGEYKHSEKLEPDNKYQKRFKICYMGYVNSKSQKRVRAYKIIYAENKQDAIERSDLYKPIIYDVIEL